MLTAMLLATALQAAPALPIENAIHLGDYAKNTKAGLVKGEIQFVQDAAAPASPNYDGWTREQLQLELRRLDDSRPGLGMPIGLIAGGAVAAIVGLYFLLYGIALVAVAGSVSGAAAVGAVLLIIGLVLVAGGATLAILGGIKLSGTLRARREASAAQEEIQRRLDGMQGGMPPPPGAPPPLPPPPQATYQPIQPQFVIAEW